MSEHRFHLFTQAELSVIYGGLKEQVWVGFHKSIGVLAEKLIEEIDTMPCNCHTCTAYRKKEALP